MFRKQWIETYKAKGIDIDKMEHDVSELQNEIHALLLRLAKTENKADVETLKAEIIEKKGRQAQIHVEKSDLLNYSIEDQLIVEVNSYYSYLALEKKVEDKWERVFKTHKEFVESKDEALVNKTFYYINFLIYS
jgi:predicted  nucleic acid-binding Zn-ribbon protein